MTFKEEIEQIAREILEKFSSFGIEIIDSKKRFEKILQESQNRREIRYYLPLKSHRKYGDFVVVVVRGGKHDVLGIKVVSSKGEVEKLERKQEELKMKFELEDRKFIEKLAIVVDYQSDENLRKDWKRALEKFLEP
jgi:hypothetical protein